MKPGEYTIKRLGMEDSEILRFLIDTFKFGFGTKRTPDGLLDRDDIHLLAVLGEDAPVGFLLGYELPRLSASDRMMFIYEIEVAEAHQNKGIGRALLDTILRYSHFKGLSKAFVITEASNTAAMKLYEAAGGYRINEDDVVFRFNTRAG